MKARTITAMVLALLIPGAGHFYLGKRGRGIAFFVIIMSLFFIGLAVEGHQYSLEGGLLNMLATIGSVGAGLPYFIARHFGPWGDIHAITYEYGSTFTVTAGLMNYLLVADVFDIAEGRKE
jgi:TM2 domain-containing membrane protein YozV